MSGLSVVVMMAAAVAKASRAYSIKHETKPGWKPWQPPPPQDDRRTRWGFRGKTAWDWLDLMIVPVMLALFAGFFTTVQIFWQSATEAERQQAIANQTAKFQRVIEEFRVQQTALQSYLDLMADLLLNQDLLGAEPGSDVVAIAQAQTLATIWRVPEELWEIIESILAKHEIRQRVPADPA